LREAGLRAIEFDEPGLEQALLDAAEHHQARLVWVFVSGREDPARMMEAMIRLGGGLMVQERRLVTCGPAALGSWMPEIAAGSAVQSMSELVSCVRSAGLVGRGINTHAVTVGLTGRR
jgi:hypothetical protein